MGKSYRIPKSRTNEFLDVLFPTVKPTGKIPAGYYPGSDYKYKVGKHSGEYILIGHSKTKGYKFKKI